MVPRNHSRITPDMSFLSGEASPFSATWRESEGFPSEEVFGASPEKDDPLQREPACIAATPLLCRGFLWKEIVLFVLVKEDDAICATGFAPVVVPCFPRLVNVRARAQFLILATSVLLDVDPRTGNQYTVVVTGVGVHSDLETRRQFDQEAGLSFVAIAPNRGYLDRRAFGYWRPLELISR